MSATVTVSNGRLEVTFGGLDRLWELKSQLSVPLAEVTDVDVLRPSDIGNGPFSKIYGKGAGPDHSSGVFKGADGTELWSVHGEEEVLVVTVADDKFSRLVLGVADPQAAADAIRRGSD